MYDYNVLNSRVPVLFYCLFIILFTLFVQVQMFISLHVLWWLLVLDVMECK